MARTADGSLRDALSLIEQARAYCGAEISESQVRELLGVVPAEVLDELVAAIENHSTERALGLVHRLLAEGQNLQQFCREAISHFRNVLVARVCGADSDLIAAPAEERPQAAHAQPPLSARKISLASSRFCFSPKKISVANRIRASTWRWGCSGLSMPRGLLHWRRFWPSLPARRRKKTRAPGSPRLGPQKLAPMRTWPQRPATPLR